jgi:hypothetical protein
MNRKRILHSSWWYYQYCLPTNIIVLFSNLGETKWSISASIYGHNSPSMQCAVSAAGGYLCIEKYLLVFVCGCFTDFSTAQWLLRVEFHEMRLLYVGSCWRLRKKWLWLDWRHHCRICLVALKKSMMNIIIANSASTKIQTTYLMSTSEVCYWFDWYVGVRGGTFCSGTVLQARSRFWFLMVWLEFFVDLILPVTQWPWGQLIL